MTDTLRSLTTEAARPDLADLDLRDTTELVLLMNDEDATVPAAVRRAAGDIARAVDAIAARMERGGRLVYLGAGTAGRVAALDAAECGPTFGTGDGVVVGLVAGGTAAFTDPHEGVEDDEQAAADDVDGLDLGPDDCLVGVSASGRTPYVLAGVRAARERGALTVGLSCNAGAALSAYSDIAIEVVVGPEVIAGSTRLKAGTAQKLVCNTLSTAVMVRLGRTYGNLMVDVRADNAKLRQRARRILVEAAGVSDAEAGELLARCDGETKVALVCALAGVDPAQARHRLASVDGRVRDALGTDG